MNIPKEVLTDINALIEALRIADEALLYCCHDDVLAVGPYNEVDLVSANEWKKMVARTACAKICKILKAIE